MDDDSIYRQLQMQLDKYPIGYPATRSGVEIDILKYFFTPGEAKIALCLPLPSVSVNKIRTNLKTKFNMDVTYDKLSAILEEMFQKGVVRRSVSSGRPPRYGMAMLALGMFEYQVDSLTPELIEMMHRYFDEAFNIEFFRSTLPQLRTSPHLAAVMPEYIVDTYDHIRHFLTHTRKPLYVSNCVCKQGEALLGKPCRQTSNIEVCLLVGESNHAQRNRARKISKAEALAILDLADEKGMVLQPGNSRDPDCVCVCCGCCCGVLTAAKKLDRPARFFATNYFARVDSALCTGCGVCVKRCQMDALVPDGDKFRIDLDRCIGCGLCVTKCKFKAAKLVPKDKKTKPPMNIELLYLSILAQKAGRTKMMINMMRMLMGNPL